MGDSAAAESGAHGDGSFDVAERASVSCAGLDNRVAAAGVRPTVVDKGVAGVGCGGAVGGAAI